MVVELEQVVSGTIHDIGLELIVLRLLFPWGFCLFELLVCQPLFSEHSSWVKKDSTHPSVIGPEMNSH